jgi:hypothetical protein
LSDSLKKSVGSHVVEAEGGEGIDSKVNSWVSVIEKTEPGGEQRALQILDSSPEVLAKDVVERLFDIARDEGAST